MRKKSQLPKIILASNSIARKFLLKKYKINFKVVPANYEEDHRAKKTPTALVKFLALNKGLEVALKNVGKIILASDTIGMVGEKLLTKPKNTADAKKMIAMQSGRKIKIITGVAIIKINREKSGKTFTKKIVFHDISSAFLKKLTKEDIHVLANQKYALKSAGGFCIEDKTGKFIRKIEGDFDNIMGLPVKKVVKLLKNF